MECLGHYFHKLFTKFWAGPAGLTVAYDENTKSFTAKTGEPGLYGVMAVDSLTQITLKIDHNELELNDKFIQNDVSPEIINGLTMMPIRAIAENLGANVLWIPSTRQVQIVR